MPLGKPALSGMEVNAGSEGRGLSITSRRPSVINSMGIISRLAIASHRRPRTQSTAAKANRDATITHGLPRQSNDRSASLSSGCSAWRTASRIASSPGSVGTTETRTESPTAATASPTGSNNLALGIARDAIASLTQRKII